MQGIELPREFEDPSITRASYSYYHEFDDIEIYNDDFYIIRLTMHFDCEVQIFIFKPDLYLLDEDDMPTIVNNDWNDHYILGYDNMNLSVDFSIMINKKLDNIKQIDVNLIRK